MTRRRPAAMTVVLAACAAIAAPACRRAGEATGPARPESPGPAPASASTPPAASPAAGLRLLDLDGRDVPPLAAIAPAAATATTTAATPGKPAIASVFLFARTDCPISNRYAPEVKKIVGEFSPRGVVFAMVYVDPKETPDAIRAHLKEYAYPVPGLRDPRHELVRATGARVTPSAAVFDAAGALVYVGRIDDRTPAFGVVRQAPTRRDLALALDDVLAHRAVAVAKTEAVGCFITDLTPEGGEQDAVSASRETK